MGTMRKRHRSVVTIGLLFAVSQLLTDCGRQDGRPQAQEITIEALQGYGITGAEVKAEWPAYLRHCAENDLF